MLYHLFCSATATRSDFDFLHVFWKVARLANKSVSSRILANGAGKVSDQIDYACPEKV